MERAKKISFSQKGDDRGRLVIIEGNVDVPFEIKRAFYIYGSDKEVVRGKHANMNSEFTLINVSGTSKIKVDYGNGETDIFDLNSPHIGVYIPKMVWKDMYDFSKDSVLLVLASTHYNGKEYIRDYDEYIKEIRDRKD